MKKIIAMSALAFLLSGCMFYQLAELRNTQPTGTQYQKELARMYMDFATQQEKGYDWVNSAYFAGKGLEAAYGHDTAPEMVDDWMIPEEKIPELEKARAALVQALTPEVKNQLPTTAANAQFHFDCWVKYQDANWQIENIDYCHEHFDRALGELQSYLMGNKMVAEPKPKKVKPKEPKPAKPAEKPAAFAPVKEEEKPKAEMEKPIEKPVAAAPKAVIETPKLEAEKPVEMKKPAEAEIEKPADKPADVSDKKAALTPHAGNPDTISFVVFFEAQKATLSGAGKSVIGEVVNAVKNSPDYEIVLRGTADGGALIAARAQSVHAALAEAGIKDGAIKMADAAGEAKPSVKRVEIYLNE